MFKKTFVLYTLIAVLVFGAILPAEQASAAYVAKPPTTVNVASTTGEGEVQPAGKLGLGVRGALIVIKVAIKEGGEVLSYVVKWLDKDTAKYLADNSSKIANGIDNAIEKIDDLTDYTTAVIRQIVLDGLRIAGVPDKYGVGIAEAIAAAVDFLLL
ncbi:MAG: hypothetical protein BLM47_12070 [Candidatus Reconcilbacillus cellulovorans]|uniref:Uncharacterized protein n=1 Tax=Candidatus Reconcilbacillus cellulovorans TaxID=1906605 RepID=A0A2A6DXR6_9BACL|nr:MAG: hypothetical protein BLM47_12070 [Candidatus Reconcilbacillus cellulovorans]